MLVNKAANAGESREVDAGELELINRWSRKKLEAKEVYAFAVRLCDNEVDRDGERFPEKTLEELARLFVGKSGIFDHKWSARGQTARIYRTELVREDGVVTEAGDGYRFLKGWAYMLRTEGNRELIAEIEGGIKKEVSVGCAVARAVCSVCGGEAGKCGHEKGAYYNGKQCWSNLVGATDAYEWSFVAVPAQRKAGVIKSAKGVGRMELKEFLKDRSEYAAELELLEREAEAGRRYLSYLRGEVLRLGGLCEPEMDTEVRRRIADKLGEEELSALRHSYEKRLDEKYPAAIQLTYRSDRAEPEQRDGAFLI